MVDFPTPEDKQKQAALRTKELNKKFNSTPVEFQKNSEFIMSAYRKAFMASKGTPAEKQVLDLGSHLRIQVSPHFHKAYENMLTEAEWKGKELETTFYAECQRRALTNELNPEEWKTLVEELSGKKKK